MEWNWNPDSFSAVATLVTVLVVVVAGYIARSQLRQLVKANKFAVVERLFERFDAPTMRRARRIVNRNEANLTELLKKWDEEDAAEYYTVVCVANFFEDLAILENEGHLTLADIEPRFASPLKWYYKLFAGYIRNEQAGDPDIYKWFRTLAEKFRTA